MSLCVNTKCKSPNPDNTLFCANCGSELLLVGRYQVVRLLSDKGGFADTYEVLHLGVPKVMKVLKEQSQKAIELFKREYEVLKRSNHSGIPKAEDYFDFIPKNSQTPLHCLVMEKILGKDLEDYIKEIGRPIDQRCALEWLQQLTQVLEEIHGKQLLHRDIKPSNIILKPNGQLVLIDFGAVKQFASIQARSQNTRIYTPGYAAPEQEQGKAVPQSDLFSLGRTFAYLLTGREPIDLCHPKTNKLTWHGHTSNISPKLIEFVDQLMEHSANQRPANAQDALQHLLSIQAMLYQPSIQKTQPSPPVPPPVSQPSSKKKRWKFFVFLLIGFLAFLLLAVAIPSLVHVISGGKSLYANFSDIDAKEVPEGEFTFGGSTTWATTRQEVAIDSAINGAFPAFQLKYVDPTKKDKDGNFIVKSVRDGKCKSKTGSNTGICMLINGDLSFSQSSTSLDKLEYAKEYPNESAKLREISVAWDALTVVLHPDLNISGLTIDQLRGIYKGEITNWSQISSGLNLRVVPLSRSLSAGGTVSSFKDMVLKGEEFNWNVIKEVRNPTHGLQEVQNIKENGIGAIFFGSAKEMIVDSCNTKPVPISQDSTNFIPSYREALRFGKECEQERNQINAEAIKPQVESQRYPLARRIFVIVKKADGIDRKAGEAYAKLLLTKQGQDLLEKAGFVSLQ